MKKFGLSLLLFAILSSSGCSSGQPSVRSYDGMLFGKTYDEHAQMVVCQYRVMSQNAGGFFEAYLHKGQTACPRYARTFTDGRGGQFLSP